MRFRILIYILICLVINIAISANQDSDMRNIESDLEAVFNVMYSMDTWGMAHDEELMSEMVEFAKNNPQNKYCFMIFDYLKRNTTWKNYRSIKPLAEIDTTNYKGWNKRYLKDLQIKYLYFLNDNDAINKICNTRYYVPEYYIVGPLEKDWNQLLRTEWSYLFDPETTFNTPFGSKKYTISKNDSYLDNLTNRSLDEEISSEDFYACTYLCAFTAYFDNDTEVLLKMNVDAKELNVNSISLSSYFPESDTKNNQIFPIRFTKGRYDFVLQTELRPYNVDIEFIAVEEEVELPIRFNSQFKHDYGIVKTQSEKSVNEYKYKYLKNFIYLSSLADEKNESIKQIVFATEVKQDMGNYNNWAELLNLHEKDDSPIVNYLFAKETSNSEILPANIKQNYIPSVFNMLVEKYPNFILPRLELFNFYFDQNKYTDALQILEQTLSIDPNNKNVWSKFISFYENRGWVSQEFKTIFRAADLFVDDTEFQLEKVNSLLIHSNNDGALKLFESLITSVPTVQETYPIWKKYAKIKTNLLESFEDKNKVWFKLVRLFKSFHSIALEDYSEFLVENNQYNLALEILLNQFEKDSTTKIARKISEIYFILDNKELGIKYLKKSVSLNPKMNSAEKDYLLDLNNDTDLEMYKKYTIPIDSLLDIDVKASDYPDSTSIVLLDEEVRRIYPDGSASSIVTSVRRILTTEGAEEYGTIHAYGDVVLAQVIKPNGEIIEPSVLGTEINFQGIEIGSTQIIVTRELAEEFNVLFYFSDPEHKEYFLTSRMVILKSKSFKDFKIEEKFVPKAETFETDDYDGFVYVVENSKPIPEEKEYNPGDSDYLPHVNVTNISIVPRKSHFYFLEDRSYYPSTFLINEKTIEICKGIDTVYGKAKAIYEFVANSVKFDFFVDNPTETLLNLSGNKVNLLLSMYQAADIKFEKIKILTSEASQIFKLSENISSGFYYADFVDALRVTDDDKYYYSLLNNETMRHTAFAVIPYTGAIGYNYQHTVDFTDIDPSNSLEYLIEKSSFDIDVKDAIVSGVGTITFDYKESSAIRSLIQEFSDTQKNLFTNQLINKRNRRFTIENYDILNLDTKTNLQINVQGQFSGALQVIDDQRIEVSQCMIPLDLVHKYTPTSNRNIKMKITDEDFENQIDSRTITIPDNYIIQNMPSSAFFITRNFMYLLNVERTDDKVMLTRKWRTNPSEYDASEYEMLKQYCQAIDEIEKTGITFLKKSEP